MTRISDEIRKVADEYDVLPLYGLSDHIDAEMVELPKDADGVPIRVGDTVYGEEEVNRLAFGYAQAVLSGAVSGKYAPENLFGNCSALLDLIGLDSGTEATRDYCSAIVQWHIDQLKGE